MGEEWQGEFWNHYSRCDKGITGHANILKPIVNAIKEIDEYLEESEQAAAERKMKALESEYLKSGYWPSDDDCPHQWRDGRCEWCGEKEAK